MIRFFQFCCLFVCLLTGCTNKSEVSPAPAGEFNEIKVMTYNILFNSSNEKTLSVLRETAADIIGMQEASPARIMELAQNLHYYYHSFSKTTGNNSDQDTGILSRFPITRSFLNGVVVKVNPKFSVAIFTVHLSPYPYEPYDFRDGIITTAVQAVASGSATRLPEIEPVLQEIKALQNEGIPVFLTGDFNEPSILDWTTLAAQNNLHFGKVVEWPVSKSVIQSGFTDAYRSRFPNSSDYPGTTWTTIESANEVYDRIDMIYQTLETAFTLTDVRLTGGKGDVAGIIVEGYPSDHYSVIATYHLQPQ